MEDGESGAKERTAPGQDPDRGTDEFPQVGEPVGQVELEIDYAIVRHFSEHLYGSPNKAIEELVANSFDAMSQEAYVYVPGEFTGLVAVWDDGESMDIAGLRAMWKIAHSPKQSENRVRGEGERERRIIGKFGIGKLASYAVGERISHLCKRGDEFLLVGVDYREVQQDLGVDEALDSTGDGAEETGGDDRVFRTDILRLTEQEAIAWVEKVLKPEAEAMAMFDKPNFTLAVVDRIHEDLVLYPGRLGWVLGNAMPLRPDFSVWVDDCKVSPRLGRDALLTWDATSERPREALKNAWAAAAAENHVEGEIEFEGITCSIPPETEVPAIRLPQLGKVAFKVNLYAHSLHREDESKDERSYGFFVMVRGRLINTDDPNLYLSPPSYGAFYRMQIVIHADGLDTDLLADRGRLRDSRRTAELEILQRALYRAGRAEIERKDEEAASDDAFYHLLPTRSQRFFREPLGALLMSTDSEPGIEEFHFDQPDVVREELPEDLPVAVVADDGSGFAINVSHPLFQALRDAVGTSRRSEKAMRAFELVAVGERLLEGYLLDAGVEPSKVKEILVWRDDLLRQLASRYRDQPEAVVSEVWSKSYKGKKAFEVALAKLFNLMGFVATRRGASGDEDVLIVAPTGESEAKFIVDAKGSKTPVKNDEAEIAQAAGHVDKVEGAEVAIVVAREFAGFRNEDGAAVLRDCRAVSKGDDVKVSIVDVPTLIELYWSIERWSHPLDIVLPVLTEIETPDAKKKRIAELDHPLDNFDCAELIEHIWARQQGDSAGDVVPYRALWQQEYRDELSFDQLKVKLSAIEVLADPLLELRVEAETVTLRQSPPLVVAQIERGFERVAGLRTDEESASDGA